MSKENKVPKIKKGIVIPKSRQWSPWIKLLRTMGVGDSFEIEKDAGGRSSLYFYANSVGISISMCTQENGKIRIWRTS